MVIDKRKTKSNIIKGLVHKYKKTGKIGTSKPDNISAAVKQAAAIAYSAKGESFDYFSNLDNLCNMAEHVL